MLLWYKYALCTFYTVESVYMSPFTMEITTSKAPGTHLAIATEV